MDWYLKVLKNYIGFGGRARRKEYWMFILVNLILTGVLSIIDKMLGWQRAGGEGILTTIYGVLVFLPWWAVQFRRLHDTDRFGLVAIAAVDPGHRLAGDPDL
ncbi:inner membrane protein YhaH [Klebsiella pneumoniae]|uniref:Inner membrane protein YhaH n=1 Tax=Klebsiella pneumoniae TaxID=573 RepID=A0A378A4M1_KLEPN|nr:inner membrane protein YhaH [Klebsiella pneumoniae]